jgi:prepilin-type N-terminal cleavage/methylation domain-containing protein
MRRTLTPSTTPTRLGFTLVEMLVVIVIVMILATLTVALTPRIAGSQKAPRGAEQLQGWLFISKNRAKRDQLPTGLRLMIDDDGYVRSLKFIQQPDDFNGGTVRVQAPKMNVVIGTGVQFTGGFVDLTQNTYPVQPGDYIEFKGGGLVHMIDGVLGANQLHLASPMPYPINDTADYRIIRKPRVLVGETPMLLPQDIVVDINTNVKYSNPLPPVSVVKDSTGLNGEQYIDLLFGPSGGVLNVPGQSSFLCLWVRDMTTEPPTGVPAEFGGEPLLVTLYKRTGSLAVHPADLVPPAKSPYTFAADGKSSGL